MSNTHKHLMLFDGDCAFCRRCVEAARKIDTRGSFAFEPSQTSSHPLLTPELRRKCEHALHVITSRGQVLSGGRACFFFLEAASRSKLARRLSRLARSFPAWIFVEAGYKLVARNRSFFSRFF